MAKALFGHVGGPDPRMVSEMRRLQQRVRDLEAELVRLQEENDALAAEAARSEDMLVLDRELVRQAGADGAARQAVTFLTRDGGPQDGFWIHLDADVFDETIMQSVDDPRPEGLTWDDGIAILRTAIASSQAAGLQIAIYNPDIDKDGSNGRGLAATIRNALAW